MTSPTAVTVDSHGSLVSKQSRLTTPWSRLGLRGKREIDGLGGADCCVRSREAPGALMVALLLSPSPSRAEAATERLACRGAEAGQLRTGGRAAACS